MSYTFVFRVDASIDIGTGHVMRCLTLAEALALRGAACHFICRTHSGHLLEHIRAKGFITHELPNDALHLRANTMGNRSVKSAQGHFHWLGSTQERDAEQCIPILSQIRPDWLVVDHYALDEHWESALKEHCPRVFVIDDLADRAHQCDLLLDQNLGRRSDDYDHLVPRNCTVLTGPQYALLRPEFRNWRPLSLRRRASPELRHLLITMGGIDQNNATSTVLAALHGADVPADCRVSVVMGANAPWLESVQQQARKLPWRVDILVDVHDMARLMSESDLAIGGAGSTALERCCLALPTILVVLAENQRRGARALHDSECAVLLGEIEDIPFKLNESIQRAKRSMAKLAYQASSTIAADGLSRVIRELWDYDS